MPEGPEHYLASDFINQSCNGKIFSGNVLKSSVTKNPCIELPFKHFLIIAESRGKELMLKLSEFYEKDIKMDLELHNQSIKFEEINVEKQDQSTFQNKILSEVKILFQFGMSGTFTFTSEADIPKHSHLKFYTFEEPKMVLSFVDIRRFGKWKISDNFSENRGPDPVREYALFRKNIITNLTKKTFQKSICEALHDQTYFNGIGNYLRAEILYRAKIPPFTLAYEVLKDLPEEKKEPHDSTPDLLDYCKLVFNEVMQLKCSFYNSFNEHSDYKIFEKWLQCYCQPNMSNLVDKDGRTIWFEGSAGPLAPKGSKAISRHKTSKNSKKKTEVIRAKKIKENSIEITESKIRKKKIKVTKKIKNILQDTNLSLRRSSRIKKK
ncbi:endonuclease 8-like 1 isoform X1 [Hydra vulgaris]|uniref:endonuclease 8-like 1 isoform X1 n=1 Tax=Hydra vulgaris TaxID=6087 RepID=UPI001F5E8A04|nr:endonuclease 8-like 1 isoform X1 [Hydra vulgaris]